VEFDEDTYRWIIDKHPIIQSRIGKIRELLPKLQAVRTRARQKSAHDSTRTRSVIEDMNSGQFSAFAVFSEVKRYQRWDAVLVEGDEADMYILPRPFACGRWQTYRRVDEADVFDWASSSPGAMATIRFASADADYVHESAEF
jgi:hypothetical protein